MDDLTLSLPISEADRAIADRFAAQQPSREKAEQVRYNTLAVQVMAQYCRLMEIPTDQMIADSWQPIVRAMANVADLAIVGVGRLECRPVWPEQSVCAVPAEVWHDRIGYVGVRIAADQQSAVILGFVPQVQTPTVPIDQWRSLDALIDHLHQYSANLAQRFTNLSQWMQREMVGAWQTLESLVGVAPEFGLAFRQEETAVIDPRTQRGKVMTLANGVTAPVVVLLLVTVRAVDESRRQIGLRLCGQGGVGAVGAAATLLPADLQLIVFDGNGDAFETLRSRSVADDIAGDDYMQVEFIGTIGEEFTVQIEQLGANPVSVIEEFVV
jgi:Protein of unknown function (DUF1822)